MATEDLGAGRFEKIKAPFLSKGVGDLPYWEACRNPEGDDAADGRACDHVEAAANGSPTQGFFEFSQNRS